jgi:beta-ketoacyl synthase-like protein
MRVFIEGVGLLGPGLNGWQASRPLIAAGQGYIQTPTVVAASDLLPAAERRRTGVPVKLALAVGCEAFANAGRAADVTATVFASSGADSENVHQICEALASAEREVSPTRFHNSVHNAAAGYWSIATRSREPSTSLCCYDASFSAGLLEATVQVAVEERPVALIAYDQPYPEPLHAVRRIDANFGVAMVLTPRPTSRTFAVIDVKFSAKASTPTPMPDRHLEIIRAGVPAARSLPLLAGLARNAAETVILEYPGPSHLSVAVAPCS